MPDKEAAKNAARLRFETQIETPQKLVTQYDNQPLPEDKRRSSEIWSRVQVRFNGTARVDTGATLGRYRTQGELIARLFAPVDKGDGDLMALADVIENAFTSVDDTGVRFRAPSTEQVGRVGSEWQVNVVCPFWFDDLR